jgi:hypothetical protein
MKISNNMVRAAVILIALVAVIAMAFIMNSEVAVGGVIAALAAGVSYLFPGGKETPAPAAPVAPVAYVAPGTAA